MMPSTTADIARDLLLAMIAKSGVREWEDDATLQAMTQRAWEIAIFYTSEDDMATSKLLLPEMDGTPKQICLFKASGFSPTTDLRKTTDGSMDAPFEIDFTSLANGAYLQSAKIDFGVLRATEYAWRGVLEMVATPNAGTALSLWMGWSHHGTAATANPGNLTGTAGAYTGYSSNAAAAVRQLDEVGYLIFTTQATATLQIAIGGTFKPMARYGILVALNGAGSAFHSSASKIHLVADPVFTQGQAA